MLAPLPAVQIVSLPGRGLGAGVRAQILDDSVQGLGDLVPERHQ